MYADVTFLDSSYSQNKKHNNLDKNFDIFGKDQLFAPYNIIHP
jgi:hypothetical protein